MAQNAAFLSDLPVCDPFCVLAFSPGLHVGPDVAERRLAQLIRAAGGASVKRIGPYSSG